MDNEPTYTPTIGVIDGQPLIFVPAGHALTVYTLDGEEVESGKEKSLNGRILFDIKIHNDRGYVGTENGHLYQFDAQGKLLKEEVIADSQFKDPSAGSSAGRTQRGVQ